MSHRSLRPNLSALTVALAVGTFTGAAQAADNYWTNANGTNRWAESGNWSLGRVPNSTDNAIIAWGTNTTSVIVDAFCQCANFTNMNNQTLISGNGYLRVHQSAVIGGGLFMYGSTPILETYGTTSLLGDLQLYKATFRTAAGANLVFESNSVATFVLNGGGVNFEGGSVTNWGTWNVNSGSFGVGNFNDADPLTVIDNRLTGRITLNAPGGVFDPSSGNHNGGNSVLINRGVFEAIGGGNNPVEADVQYWVLDLGATRARNNSGFDFKSPVNLDANGGLDRGAWIMEDTSYIAFAGAGRYVTEIGAGASVWMNGPNAHMYGIDQVTSIRGLLSVSGGRQLLLQPLAPVTQHSGKVYVGTGSSVTLWQTFTQAGGTIQREVTTPADAATPAIAASNVANVYGHVQIDVNGGPNAVNTLYAVVSAGWGVGGQFGSYLISGAGGPATDFYTNNDAMLRVAPPCPCDLNADARIDTADLVIFLGQFGSNKPARFDGADFNGDLTVDTADLVIFLGRFGIAC